MFAPHFTAEQKRVQAEEIMIHMLKAEREFCQEQLERLDKGAWSAVASGAVRGILSQGRARFCSCRAAGGRGGGVRGACTNSERPRSAWHRCRASLTTTWAARRERAERFARGWG